MYVCFNYVNIHSYACNRMYASKHACMFVRMLVCTYNAYDNTHGQSSDIFLPILVFKFHFISWYYSDKFYRPFKQ